MRKIFISSDPHFGHENAWKLFKGVDGNPLRPFSSTEEMNEVMIARHNAVVKPEDHWYCLGDVVINKKFLHLINRLNGHKRLVMGNHDIYDNKMYYEAGFEKIMAVRVFDGMILTHIPIHSESIARFGINVHGHLHGNVVNDPRYLCVSVEQINYTPIGFDEVRARAAENQKLWDGGRTVKHWPTGRNWKEFVDVKFSGAS